MNISPKEIESVEDAGTMNAAPVKMIKTKGGLWIAVGRRKGQSTDEALSAGSHRAIVQYNMEKNFAEFQPSLMKSEGAVDASVVDQHSHFLSDDLRKSGHDLYSVQDGNRIEFHVMKHGAKVTQIDASLVGKEIVFGDMPSNAAPFSRAVAGATAEKAISVKATKIVIGKK